MKELRDIHIGLGLRHPTLFQRCIAWLSLRVWPTEWALRVLHTHPDSDTWLYRSE